VTQLVLQAYRFALDPTDGQVAALNSHCGAQRFAYNWGLRLIQANLNQREAERSYGIADRQLTPAVNLTAYGLRKAWNLAKENDAPWWRENSKEAYSSGLANLAAAMTAWTKSRKRERRGVAVGFPKFKPKKSRLSCRFSTGAIGLSRLDRRHVRLPRIGVIRTHESTRKLARLIERGSARIRSATVSFVRGRWFVSFSVEADRPTDAAPCGAGVIGVDLGIKKLAVLSRPVGGVSDDQGVVENPDHLERAQKSLRRLNRQASRRDGPGRGRDNQPSKRWRRTQRRIRKSHARIVQGRLNALHHFTTALTQRVGTVVIEDLHIAGMLKNHCLARRISGSGWGELRRQLTYKSAWRGGSLIVAERFYPSSKTCSRCGAVKTKLHLSQRVFDCDVCGLSMDRDRNAALNLATLAVEVIDGVASSQSCGVTINEPDGNPRETGRAGGGYCHGKPHEGNAA
jgi:putative transposase